MFSSHYLKQLHLLVEEERDKMMAWQMGVSFEPKWGIDQTRRPLEWGIRIRSVLAMVKRFRNFNKLKINYLAVNAFVMKAFALILLTTNATNAQQVIPQSGVGCPSGYSNSSGYCKPRNGTRDAFIKNGRFCPSGYHSTGDYCLSNN